LTEEKDTLQKRSSAVSIGAKLKGLRIEKGVSQVEMSKILGMARSTWRMYESGQRIPNDEVKLKIARYFDKTVDELFFNF
jgi:putative transcriptional regulator